MIYNDLFLIYFLYWLTNDSFGIVANYHASLDVMDFFCKILFFMIYNDCTAVYKQKSYFESKILLKTHWSHQSICTKWNNLKEKKTLNSTHFIGSALLA